MTIEEFRQQFEGLVTNEPPPLQFEGLLDDFGVE
jgi:hypothetical protein